MIDDALYVLVDYMEMKSSKEEEGEEDIQSSSSSKGTIPCDYCSYDISTILNSLSLTTAIDDEENDMDICDIYRRRCNQLIEMKDHRPRCLYCRSPINALNYMRYLVVQPPRQLFGHSISSQRSVHKEMEYKLRLTNSSSCSNLNTKLKKEVIEGDDKRSRSMKRDMVDLHPIPPSLERMKIH